MAAGTSATLLARKWESALLVNVDNDTLRRIMDDPKAMAAVERVGGWRSLGDNIIETIINRSEKVKELKNNAKEREKEKKGHTAEEKVYKSKRKLVQEKLIKFATRIPAFMCLTAVHGYPEPRWTDPLRAVRHCGGEGVKRGGAPADPRPRARKARR
jgi:hypothetical protein